MSKFFKTAQLIAPEDKPLHLAKWATDIGEIHPADKYDELFAAHKEHIAKRQNLLYADARYGVLVIFQGMDAAGKDGAIRHVMSCLNPLGASATAFAAPSQEELRHDFLWRTHNKIPSRGKVGVFNRSYYEEVLTVRVHPELLAKQTLPPEHSRGQQVWRDRLADIRHHEQYLHRQGYRIIKFYLHMSKAEQRKRLLSRCEDPDKNWKVTPDDIRDHRLYTRYRSAYEQAIAATSTAEAPWYVIPADDKRTARILISQIMVEQLDRLPLRFPRANSEQKQLIAEARRQLKSR